MRALRMLVVDDDRDFARSLAFLLEIEGYRVEMAFSGEEAVRKSREQDFDLTFMDVMLPGMSGIESFFEIRNMKPDAKVLIITGFSVEERLREAVKAGALGVLEKPFDPEALLQTIAALEVKPGDP